MKIKRAAWRLTPQERKQIRALCTQGVSNAAIGRVIQVHPQTVAKIRKEYGLPVQKSLPEKQIVQLSGTMGQRQVAKLTGVWYPRVGKFMRELFQTLSVTEIAEKYSVDPLQIRRTKRFYVARKKAKRTPSRILNQVEHLALMSSIMHQKASASALAKEFGQPYYRVLGLAHAYRDCKRFVTFSNPPLESYFPSAPVPAMKPPEDLSNAFVRIVSAKVQEWFNGYLPPVADWQFVEILMAAMNETVLKDKPKPVQESFEQGLLQAVRTLRTSEAGWVN